jgi:hypothetical protein
VEMRSDFRLLCNPCKRSETSEGRHYDEHQVRRGRPHCVPHSRRRRLSQYNARGEGQRLRKRECGLYSRGSFSIILWVTMDTQRLVGIGEPTAGVDGSTGIGYSHRQPQLPPPTGRGSEQVASLVVPSCSSGRRYGWVGARIDDSNVALGLRRLMRGIQLAVGRKG